MSFFDFNTADQQQSFDLIPKGTLARVRMSIKPGGFDDASQGWTGGWATQSHDSGAVYLACEGVVMEGPFARRKVWWNIGLYSAKGPTWGNMGRTFVRAALNSARNIHPGDNSPQAQAARRISGFGDLEGLEFVARFDIEKDGRGEDRNTIKSVIEPITRTTPRSWAWHPGAGWVIRAVARPVHRRLLLHRATPRQRPLHAPHPPASPAANPPGHSKGRPSP